MDFQEIALNSQAFKDPVGIGMCHDAVVKWLCLAKLISEDEANVILNFQQNHKKFPEYGEFLVNSADPMIGRVGLEAIGGGTVIGVVQRHDYVENNLQHSAVKLNNGKVAGVNNVIFTNGKYKQNKYAVFPISDIFWHAKNWDNLAYHSDIHYQHPGVIANRICRYVKNYL